MLVLPVTERVEKAHECFAHATHLGSRNEVVERERRLRRRGETARRVHLEPALTVSHQSHETDVVDGAKGAIPAAAAEGDLELAR